MLPSAIIFVNNDITDQIKNVLINQLFIFESIDGYEFDLRVQNDPNYPNTLHLNNLRLLVVRSFYELNNRNLADIVIFVKAGLLSIESNKYGPHGQTFPVDRINIYKLLKNYPISTNLTNSENVQNNIIYPMEKPYNFPDNYPFGSRGSIIPGGRGALVEVEGDMFVLTSNDNFGNIT